ncbi:MAG: hypothetical protein IRZ14_04710 [Chloroflexi bacterium]|nr:hypothetical protein [Chloroflexota bacterium]
MSGIAMAEGPSALRVRRALEARLDRVVTLARELLASTLFARGDDHRGTFREAQLRNAVVVAGSTESLEAIKSWVRYQVGREAGRGGWRHRDFGEALVRQIEQELAALASEIATTADAAEVQPAIHVALTRQYLGYLHRHFVFAEMERQRERRTAQAARGSGR